MQCVQDCRRLVSLKLTAIQITLLHVDKLMSQESAVVVNKQKSSASFEDTNFMAVRTILRLSRLNMGSRSCQVGMDVNVTVQPSARTCMISNSLPVVLSYVKNKLL